MVLSRSSAKSRRPLLTISAVLDPSQRSKWQRHHVHNSHPTFTTVATFVLVTLAACVSELGAEGAVMKAPHFYQDLPAHISYFMEDGLTLNCSVLSTGYAQSSFSDDSGIGDVRGKSNAESQAMISWFRIEDDGSAKELNDAERLYKFNKDRTKIEIKSIHSGNDRLNEIKGSYYCQAKNNFGTTRSRTCVINPVSSTVSVKKVKIVAETNSESGAPITILSCKVIPQYAHPYYRLIGWKIVNPRPGSVPQLITNSTRKYSIVTTVYPWEFHIRFMTKEDSVKKYYCIVELTVRQTKPTQWNRTIQSDPISITYGIDGRILTTPFLMLSHRSITINARQGTTIELPCVFIFSAPVIYKWYHNKVQVYPLEPGKQSACKDKYQVLDHNHVNLLITNLNEADEGKYECKGATMNGHRVNHVGVIQLNVGSPLGVTVTPTSQNVDFKSSATMECHVQGRPLSRVYWLHNGEPVKPSANIEVSDKSNHRLTIKKAGRKTGGVFQCFAESGPAATPDDNAQGRTVVTIVKMPPQLVHQYPPVHTGDQRGHVLLGTVKPSHMKKEGGPSTEVHLRCDFDGHPEPRITWYRDDVRIPLSGDVIKLGTAPWKDLYIDMKLAYQKSDGNIDKGVEYGGEYTAEAVNEHGKAKCRSFVEVDAEMVIRKFNLDPQIEGKNFRLKCYVLGRGTFKDLKITWNKTDRNGAISFLPNNHRHKIEENGRTLLIKNMKKEEDDGTYTCTAKNAVGKSVVKTVKLNVSRQPVINPFVTNYYVDEGIDKVTITCNIKNQADEPWFAWWVYYNPKTKESKDLRNSRSVSGVKITYSKNTENLYDPEKMIDVPLFVPPNTWVMLEIGRPEKSTHTGNYTCIIANKVGENRKSATVTFKPKIKFKVKPPANKEVILSEDLILHCSATGSNPKPTVEWKYFESTDNSYTSVRSLEIVTKRRISQSANGTLVVSNISKSDPTRYMCYVSLNVSDAEAISQVVKVNVHYPAFIRPMKNQERKVGQTFNISCQVEGDGEIESEWMIYNNSTKQFQPLQVPCFGKTDDDKDVEVSMPCRNFATKNMAAPNLFRIKFRPKNDHGIIHRLSFSKVSSRNQNVYKCRARNKYNKRGTYAEREVKLTVIGRPALPENPSVTQYTARSLTFTWARPLSNGNKPITHYRLIYYRISDTRTFEDSVIELNITATPGQKRFSKMIDNLHPAYEYRVDVAAVNDVGSSEVAYITQRTQEDKPSGPVQSISANGTNSDTIRISWLPPVEDKINGILTSYDICLMPAETKQTKNEKDKKKEEEENKHKEPKFWKDPTKRLCKKVKSAKKSNGKADGGLTFFRGLPKFTKYYVRIRATNSKGASPPAYSFARTLEDVPREPPTAVTCTPGSTSVQLQWNPPNQDSMNGILTGYSIRFFETNDYEDESSAVILNSSSSTSKSVEKLLKFTNYTFRISAVNSKGSGPASDPITCRTKPSEPDVPNGVKVFPVNHTCVAVSWRHPKHSNGHLESYSIRYVGALAVSRVITVSANLSNTFQYTYICELSEVNDYRVSVRAKNHAAFYSNYTKELTVTPTMLAPAHILAFDERVTTNDNADLKLSCEHVGSPPVDLVWQQDGITLLTGKTWLVIPNIQFNQRGRYTCQVTNDENTDDLDTMVSYDVDVRVIKLTPPNPPKLSPSRQQLNSVEVTWRPTGTARYRAQRNPILRYWLTYYNEYTKERHTVAVNPNNRTFFLSNLTCATNVVFSIKAENSVGNSTKSSVVQMVTRGSRPIPDDLRDAQSNLPHTYNYLNLTSVFGAGQGCMALEYRLWVSPRQGKYDKPPIIVRAYELENQCCYNLTGLNAGSRYKFVMQARNAAGSVNVSGEFVTLTKNGQVPSVNNLHKTAKPNIWQRPHVLTGLIFVMVVLVSIVLAGVLLWRRRVAAAQMRENEKGPVTRCVNDLKGDEGKPEAGLPHQFIRPHLAGLPPQSRIRSRNEDDEVERLSNDGSVDSDGNINPYATFATYESNTIDRHELPDAGPRELGAVERESGRMRERMTTHNSQKRKRYYDSHGLPKQYENESVPGTLASMGSKRRSNSLEDLDSAYNRGYATGGGGQMGRSFYESKYTDQHTPYRGSSVISSTTMSSNHDELSQAYEYGRRARLESGLNTNEIFPEDNLDLHTGSGSSETTDPGIRQFTQQPPMPDEQRQATCEVPLFSNQQRRTSVNPSETYEAVDEAYYKRGVQRQQLHHPARQAPLPDLPPLSATTLGRPRIMAAAHRAASQFRNRSDSDSVYGGPGHVYDSTDSYYSYTPNNFGRRMPLAPGGDFPRHSRQMPSSRYYNGGGPSERHPLMGRGATAAAPRPLIYGAHGADPDESRLPLMDRRYSTRGGDSGVGSSGISGGGISGGGISGGGISGGGINSSIVAIAAGARRPSRPTVAGPRPEGIPPGVLGAAAPGAIGGDSDSEAENIYTSEFTVV